MYILLPQNISKKTGLRLNLQYNQRKGGRVLKRVVYFLALKGIFTTRCYKKMFLQDVFPEKGGLSLFKGILLTINKDVLYNICVIIINMETKLKEPTIRQKRAAEEIVSNKHNSVGSALKEAGYSDSIAHNPHLVTGAKGFKDYLTKLKLDKDSRLKRLSEIFYADDKRSALGANREITKMLGEYAPTKFQDMTPKDAFDKVIKEIKVNEETIEE